MSIRIMFHPWMLVALSWVAPARLQYIDSAAPVPETLDLDGQYELFSHYFSPPFDPFQTDLAVNYQPQRKRRTAEDPAPAPVPEAKPWRSNLVDNDKTIYYKGDISAPIIADYNDDNQTEVDKRNFSPWGGKRDRPHASFEHMWSWKRSSGIREPKMPKRVRFSPWGGKRSGQMVLKPGVKASKIIFFSTIPELKRIVSNYSPGNGKQIRSFEFIPGMDKRHPIKILAMSSGSMDLDRPQREALPFSSLEDSSPKMFKPGHPYNEVHLKKDGKRKMKFSIWGGKRSPPIIGPIWTPASEDLQDSMLHTVVLLRNSARTDSPPTL